MRSLARGLSSLFVLALVVGSLGMVGTSAAAVAHGTTTQISAGGYSACSITPSKRLKCWGHNGYGQLGLGNDLSDRLTPVLVPGLRNVVQVSVGDNSTCAVLKGGQAKCWGYNSVGQLGDGTTTDRHRPTQVLGLARGVKSVSVGYYHACALRTNGTVKCWGSNNNGGIGNRTSGNEYHRPKLVYGISDATQVSAGLDYSCAMINGRAKCWGANTYGQLGDQTVNDRNKPTQVFGLTSGVKRVIAGYYTTCALLQGGKLKCWGENVYGEVGNGTSGNEYHRPVQVTGMTRGVTSVDSDYYFTCAVRNGSAKCWGDNQYNQLGDGTPKVRDTPRQVSGLTSGVKTVDISWYSGCALLTNGKAKCWGWNGEGEVGIGSMADQIPTPKVVHL
jgi:alpha-tubulin suppressor-like RCC1 family protein